MTNRKKLIYLFKSHLPFFKSSFSLPLGFELVGNSHGDGGVGEDFVIHSIRSDPETEYSFILEKFLGAIEVSFVSNSVFGGVGKLYHESGFDVIKRSDAESSDEGAPQEGQGVVYVGHFSEGDPAFFVNIVIGSSEGNVQNNGSDDIG